MALNIAKTALAAQRYGMDVTSHNIANINTPGYSRQNPVYASTPPSGSGKVAIGRGVGVTEVLRSTDHFIEDQLMQRESGLVASKEMEKYIQILEGLFNEATGVGLSSIISDFWNFWQDIASNPSGASERIALYEKSLLLSEQFRQVDAELTQIETDLTSTVSGEIERINQVIDEIADLNREIIGAETRGVANDLRDKRGILVSELAQHINVKTFEQSQGAVTVVTAKGCILVQDDSSYDLELGGANGDRVKWRGSDGSSIDITNHITDGKTAGCLDMRDEVVAKYKRDLNALANKLILVVNQQHSQGVGLKLFEPGSTLAGTYETNTDLGELAFSGEIQFMADGFKLWIEDRADPANPVMGSVSIDLSGLDNSATLTDLATAVNNQIAAAGLAGISLDGSGTVLKFAAGNDYAFGFSDDDSNILAALGVNTFFQGVGSGSIDMNDVIMNDKDYIAAGKIDGTGNYATGDNRNALAVGDLQYASMPIPEWTCDRINGNTEGSTTTTIEDYYHALVGTIGIISSSISSDCEFNESMVNRLGEIRDSVSAVSIDEEMTNLIKFQHAYAAASKIISVTDEMLNTLLSIK